MKAKYLKFLISSVAFAAFASAQESAVADSVLQPITATAPAAADSSLPSEEVVAQPAEQSVVDSTLAAAQPAEQPVADTTLAAAQPAEQSVADSTQLSPADTTQQAAAEELQATAEEPQAAPVEAAAAETAVTVEESGEPDESVPVVYTEIAGSLSGFLTKAKSPYIATADLQVAENEALVIDAGVEILFKPGTGFNVQGGALAAVGQEESPILLKGDGKWKGVSITGETRATLNNLQIENAETAIALENTGADIRNLKVKNANIGLSLKKSSTNLQNSSFGNCSGIAIFAGEGSSVAVGNVEISGGKAGYLADRNSSSNLSNVSITKNDFGFVDLGQNTLNFTNLRVQENDIGFATAQMPTQAMMEAASNNRVNTAGQANDIAMALPTPPENALAQKFKASEETVSPTNIYEEPPKKWRLSGNVATEVGYHLVRTLHNGTGEDFVMEHDTVKSGDRYNNYFQVPGLFSNYSTYLKLESPYGQTMEFTAEVGSDHWNEWNVHKVNATYTDATRQISLGDTYMNGGTTYMNGINVFGASYTVDYLKKPGERPTFQTTVFAGETDRPKLVGERNPDIYKDYVEDGEGEPQEVVAGGMITWNMHRRFNGTVGFIASENYKEDPFFRDGMGSSKNTIDPEISSRTFFAEGNWLFWPGNIELNGQVAIGAADTTDARTQRAINSVFSQAGVTVSNFALLRRIMRDDKIIATLDRKTLEEIFGDNTSMAPSEMREQLRALIKQARQAESKYDKNDDDQGDISEWDGNNFAVMASMRWGIGSTTLNAYYKFVGSKFYSAGSPDQLSNSRELGASIEQRIKKFWRLNLGYDLNVENAAIGNKANIFGLSEGTNAGFFGDPTSDWQKKHDQDDLRALYIHNAALRNKFNIGNFELALNYKLNYRARHRATRLYAEFAPETGVFDDDWFKPNGKDIYTMEGDYGTVSVDSARFLEYYKLASENDHLASDFQEKFLKHTVEADLGFKFYKNILKLGASWSFRTDLSEFGNDSLLSHFDFSDKTYGYLGYHFHSTDYFEQRYPISLTTETERIRNQFMFVPRYKIYDRDNMKEFEWSLSDQFEMEIVKNFVDVMLSGEIRQEFVRRHSDGTNESEADVNTSTTVRIHHTKDLYSDYTFGTIYNYRPDSRSEQYSDYFGVISLNYAF